MNDLARRLELKTSQLTEILEFIKVSKPTSKELISTFGLSRSYIKRLLRALRPLLLSSDRQIVLNRRGLELTSPPAYQAGLKINFNEIRRKLPEFRKDLPKPKRELDQFRATEDTVIKRVMFMMENEDLFGREIVFLGDNDLTSVAASLTGLPKSVTVLDIDANVLDLIFEISKKEGLGIKVLRHDLKDRLPRSLEKGFDVSFSDPPFTYFAFTLFLQRSLDAIRQNLASSIYICYGTSVLSRERSLLAQKIVTDAGLLILEKKEAFNIYEGAESIGSRSDLYLLGVTPKTKKRIYNGGKRDRIYTFQ